MITRRSYFFEKGLLRAQKMKKSGEIRHRALLNLLAKANSKLIAPSALARLVVTPGGGGGRVDGGGATGEAAAAAAAIFHQTTHPNNSYTYSRFLN